MAPHLRFQRPTVGLMGGSAAIRWRQTTSIGREKQARFFLLASHFANCAPRSWPARWPPTPNEAGDATGRPPEAGESRGLCSPIFFFRSQFRLGAGGDRPRTSHFFSEGFFRAGQNAARRNPEGRGGGNGPRGSYQKNLRARLVARPPPPPPPPPPTTPTPTPPPPHTPPPPPPPTPPPRKKRIDGAPLARAACRIRGD